MYFFLAQGLISAPLTPDEDEFIETIPTTLFSAREMLKTGEIIDSKTALGIFLAENFFRQNNLLEK
jgi:ADP-ribose pyrophosphatase